MIGPLFHYTGNYSVGCALPCLAVPHSLPVGVPALSADSESDRNMDYVFIGGQYPREEKRDLGRFFIAGTPSDFPPERPGTTNKLYIKVQCR